MRVRLLPSSCDGSGNQFATTYLIDGKVAIDAGSLGFADLSDQQAVRHVFLSHTHADHIGTLPLFVETVYEPTPDCVTVWGSAEVLECLQEDVFNGRVFPDFVRGAPADAPWLRLERLDAEVPVSVEHLEILPVFVDHAVPTLGFVVQSADATILIVSDTGPTTRVWEVANALPRLDAVFLEASFPERMRDIAVVSKHLTPAMLGVEIAKLERDAPIIALHLKARFRDEIGAELAALGIGGLEIAQPGKEYRFGR